MGHWVPSSPSARLGFGADEIQALTADPREPLFVVQAPRNARLGVATGGSLATDGRPGIACVGVLAGMFPEWLGDRTFTETHGLRFPYVVGEMAHGIATEAMVVAAARGGCLGFFGSAGLNLGRVERAIDGLREALEPKSQAWGVNLIHTPHDPQFESQCVDLYLHKGVRRVSVSAFMALTETVVRCAATGLRRRSDGSVERQRYLFPKVSRVEVARQFMQPPPTAILTRLVRTGRLTTEEAALARELPVAEDITIEADSGGHTDNRPLPVVLPLALLARDEVMRTYGFRTPIRVGAAGGLGTPAAVASAFASGASYVLTGSINQSAIESGVDARARSMLAAAGPDDMAMTVAADMFELGAKVQVLQRGTMYPQRANRLLELYRSHTSLDDLPVRARLELEQNVFRRTFEEVWADVVEYFRTRNPAELARADIDAKHKLALCFRWYLGRSSEWAERGVEGREVDYQLWCGPALGAFNRWVKGSFLESVEHRSVMQIAANLLEGAAVITRSQHLRSGGVPVPAGCFEFVPRRLAFVTP